jgi:uncharacterized membrane protein
VPYRSVVQGLEISRPEWWAVAVGSVSFSKARVEAFSDGVFAIAITLLVLGFQVPQPTPDGDAGLARNLIAMWPQYVVYAASFATIGIVWMNHHSLFNHMERISHGVMTANLALLLFVSFLPYPTSVLGRDGVTPVAVIYYGLTMVALSVCFNVLGYLASLTPSQPAQLLDFLRKRNLWNTAGLLVYMIGVGLAYVAPAWTIALYAAMAAYYLSPAALRGNTAAQAARATPSKG